MGNQFYVLAPANKELGHAARGKNKSWSYCSGLTAVAMVALVTENKGLQFHYFPACPHHLQHISDSSNMVTDTRP